MLRGSTMTYSEKLKDPRWQKRRLELLQQADWTCQNDRCGSKADTLHVHHLFYEKGIEPWEYEDYQYRILCENCHKKWHEEMEPAVHDLLENIACRSIDPGTIDTIGAMLTSFYYCEQRLGYPPEEIYYKLSVALFTSDLDGLYQRISQALDSHIRTQHSLEAEELRRRREQI